MKIKSLDPRINRIQIDADTENPQAMLHPLENWPTYEVFHQKKRGTHHEHVGVVHATSSELALAFAKEQFARRGETVNLGEIRRHDGNRLFRRRCVCDHPREIVPRPSRVFRQRKNRPMGRQTKKSCRITSSNPYSNSFCNWQIICW